MFEIIRVGPPPGRPRLTAPSGLADGDFEKIARELGTLPFKARKTGFVAAREARKREHVDTYWNGKETENVAHPGDFVVTSLTPTKSVLRDGDGKANIYVISRAKFAKLYVPDAGKTEFGDVYRSISVVDAIFLAGGFDILAPWGKPQSAESGYVLKSGSEIYGNSKDTFEQTYEMP